MMVQMTKQSERWSYGAGEIVKIVHETSKSARISPCDIESEEVSPRGRSGRNDCLQSHVDGRTSKMAFYIVGQSGSCTSTLPLLFCNDGGIEGCEGVADVSERRIRGSG